MNTNQLSLSLAHAIVINDTKFLTERREPFKCVYIIDGLYVGATNDLKRRIREYIGRSARNEKPGKETPVMAYIKQRLSGGHKIKFYIPHTEPCREGMFIQRYLKRGLNLLNNPDAQDYATCYSQGKYGFYYRLKQQNGQQGW